jgi:hypothetical protein
MFFKLIADCCCDASGKSTYQVAFDGDENFSFKCQPNDTHLQKESCTHSTSCDMWEPTPPIDIPISKVSANHFGKYRCFDSQAEIYLFVLGNHESYHTHHVRSVFHVTWFSCKIFVCAL